MVLRRRETKKTEDTAEPSMEKTSQLQKEVERLETELKRTTSKPSHRIGVAFIIPGALSLILSVIDFKELLSQTPLAPIAPSITGNTQVLAFIGLGLVFWGALFLLVRPISYVKSSLLDATAISLYTTIDRITKDLKYGSKGYYIPAFPKEVYLPEHLKGLKEMIVFISANDNTELPSIEKIAESKFILENPKGIIIAPPGLGLVDQFEQELRISVTTIDLKELCEVLPKTIVEDLQLAREMTMETEENQVHLTVTDSIYKDLYYKSNLESVHLLGSPLVSAIACAIATATGKTVIIQESKIEQDIDTIEVSYRLIEG